jgi:hypothetical protein
MRDSLNMFYAFCRIVNAPLQAFSRRPGTCGCRFFGAPALLALFAVLLICAYVTQRDFSRLPVKGRYFDAVPFFLLLYLGSLFEHKARYGKLSASQKASIHSHWGGYSIWIKTGLVKSERAARLFAEPICWGVFGWILRDLKICYVPDASIFVGSLGTYFIIGAVTMFSEAMIDDLVDSARLRGIQDAQVENANFARLYQKGKER